MLFPFQVLEGLIKAFITIITPLCIIICRVKSNTCLLTHFRVLIPKTAAVLLKKVILFTKQVHFVTFLLLITICKVKKFCIILNKLPQRHDSCLSLSQITTIY